ncbi:hypothetical protein [Rhizobium tubonense]|uniref:Uncharacterized protein n=1 Tax=Rhizobium tubonense TaxID=484088 RepID=A0A2W4C8D7_9HYPH|nr:hypothetical protein [Rhizobium tubonense]PZM09201.1 hypothetical protein CPY51_27180 [Rhizobium tubonense]
MKFSAILVLLIGVATPAVAAETDHTYTWSKAQWGYYKNQLSDPEVYNRTVDSCKSQPATEEALQKLSVVMHVPKSAVKQEYCRRTLKAYASGTVTYDEYLTYRTTHVASKSLTRAIQGH